MRRIILSGASSPIGSELLRRRAAWGSAELLLLTHRQAIAGFACLNCDLLAPSTEVLSEIRGFRADTLLHLVWSPTSAAAHGSYMHFKCLTGSLQLADAFIQSGGEQLLGCGTFAEYGPGPGPGSLLTESAPLAPLTLYARMRCALHTVLEEICRARGVAFAWARIFSSFGRENDRQRLSAQLLDTLTAGRQLTIRTAQLVCDYIYFKDIARAILQLTETCPDCGAVNICSGQPVAVGEFAQEFTSALGREELLVLERQATTQPSLDCRPTAQAA